MRYADQCMTKNLLVSARLEENISEELMRFLPDMQKEFIADSLQLLEYHFACQHQEEAGVAAAHQMPDFYDHSFIVFPLAKAYEGFLKYFFFQMHIITKEQYHSHKFRIGRSFNPDLPEKFRDNEWLFDDVAKFCSREMALEMWDIWLTGRNHLFHYFPDERHVLTLDQARKKVQEFLHVMERALACKIQTQ